MPFAFGSAQLGAAAQAVLRQMVGDFPRDARITIAGRTDSTGPGVVNDALALARAQAVRDHLVRVRPELAPALTLDAQGSCCFTASNETAAGRARNRRVDVIAEHAASPH
ncbi:OmpA family protein [Ottowia sp.]|uniref:OmpA family protein n=1 Tax=Ottowia sp. TaxID=1898956 RepID=UPI0026311494|nr:OmpA family protein [Ottowia sp.]